RPVLGSRTVSQDYETRHGRSDLVDRVTGERHALPELEPRPLNPDDFDAPQRVDVSVEGSIGLGASLGPTGVDGLLERRRRLRRAARGERRNGNRVADDDGEDRGGERRDLAG